MKHLKKHIILFLFYFICGYLSAQQWEYEKAITQDDTLCFFHIRQGNPRPKSDKFYYWFYQGRIHHSYGGYTAILLDGPYRQMSLTDHQLLSKGSFYMGLKTAVWKFWNANGSLLRQEWWHRGVLKKFQLFNLSEEIIEDGSYNQKGFSGKRILYSDSSKEIIQYKNGRLIVPHRKHDKKKQGNENIDATHHG